MRLRLIVGAALALLGVAAGSARAEDWEVTGEFGWFGVGKAQQLEKGHIFWVGEFSGSFFNDKGEGSLFHLAGVRCPGSNDLDFNNKKGRAAGYCIIGDPGGDQAFVNWQCEGTPSVCHGNFEYTGGTGRYQGVSGKYPFTGVTQVNWQDGTASGYATWNR